MKKLFFITFLSLISFVSLAQTLRIHLKNGAKVSYSAEQVDYIDFVEQDVEPEPEVVVQHNEEPYFSETVELMGLIWRMAGAEEFNQCLVSSVTQSADTYFASMKNHQAVTLAQQYRYNYGIAYDAVTGYANQLIFNEQGEIIFDPDYIEGSNAGFIRWTQQQRDEMLAKVNDFYKVSNFHEWFVSTKPEQELSIAAFKNVCEIDYSWFDNFYGKNDKLTSRIILSFMIGGNNNGISLMRKDGTLLLTPVLGCLNQYNGKIYFNGDMNLIVHEFSHPFCNPLIEKNWQAISKKSEEIYKKVKIVMTNQAYSNATTMMCETLVRSCAIRYMMSHNQKHLVNETLAYEESRGFMMVRTLVNILEKRELEPEKYATLEDFMPEIIEAINNFEMPEDPKAEPETGPLEYVDLGIEMGDGKKLYFATRNVGETTPGGFGKNAYRWGATIEDGIPYSMDCEFQGWPYGTKLDAAHDIATIKWGGDWHIPNVYEWETLMKQCDYERKEAADCMYGVSGYFFYNKSDHSKFIFLPVATWSNELEYWTADVFGDEVFYGSALARTFNSYQDDFGCMGTAAIISLGFAVRPVIKAKDSFDANGHEYADLGLTTYDGCKLYFATMNVGETTPSGVGSESYPWGATENKGIAWSISYPKLDSDHDIATIKWGAEWHTPSYEEWMMLLKQCDYERKEAAECMYGVSGYFFYNKSDHSKFIFLPNAPWLDAPAYWTSELVTSGDAIVFDGGDGVLGFGFAGLDSVGFAVRPVCVK